MKEDSSIHERGNSKKVCIIAFDSLDHRLIEQYDLKHIEQMCFGRIDMTGFGADLLSTPTIWTSFMTGLSPEEHGVIGWKWDNPVAEKLKNLSVKIGLSKIVVGSKPLTRLTSRMIKNKSIPSVKGRIPTIFDYASHPVDIDVPCYSADSYEEVRHDLTYGVGNPIAERQTVEKAWKAFWTKKQRVLDALSGNWDLFMAHFYLPDVLQHLFWYRKEEIEKMYREMDNTAQAINKSVGEKTFTLFLSDHGQEKGIHTARAFYSCNQKLSINKPKITDFAGIIQQKLGVPSRSDIDEVKKRLKELGYI